MEAPLNDTARGEEEEEQTSWVPYNMAPSVSTQHHIDTPSDALDQLSDIRTRDFKRKRVVDRDENALTNSSDHTLAKSHELIPPARLVPIVCD